MRHPQVGGLTVWCEKLAIGGAAGQTLVVYHAEPGTSSAEKLILLATLIDQPDSDAPVTIPRGHAGADRSGQPAEQR